jgi:hypothetical protein
LLRYHYPTFPTTLNQFLSKSAAARGTKMDVEMFNNQRKNREEHEKVFRSSQSSVTALSPWYRMNGDSGLLRLVKKMDVVKHNPQPPPPTPKVSSIRNEDSEVDADYTNAQIAQEVFHRLRPARPQSPLASQTYDQIDESSVSDSESFDDCTSSTSSTSSGRRCDSLMEDDRASISQLITRHRRQKRGSGRQQSAATQAIFGHMALRLKHQEQRCDEVQKKLEFQMSKRVADKDKLDAAYDGWQDEDYCG